MPENPNDQIPQRTEPAIQPDAAAPVEPEVEEVAVNPTEQLSETLSNPATVQAVIEFLAEEDLTIDDVTVTAGFWGWSAGADCATIELGSKEYFVSPNAETTNALAIALVKQDLEQNPEIFSPNFIESYINLDRLRRDLWSDVSNQIYESPDSYGIQAEIPEEEFDENDNVTNQEEIDAATEAGVDEEAVEAKVTEILADPLEYLRDIYGPDAVKEAIRIAGINIDEAAEDAVAADGDGHFLASYDGNVNSLPSGGDYWRHN